MAVNQLVGWVVSDKRPDIVYFSDETMPCIILILHNLYLKNANSIKRLPSCRTGRARAHLLFYLHATYRFHCVALRHRHKSIFIYAPFFFKYCHVNRATIKTLLHIGEFGDPCLYTEYSLIHYLHSTAAQ